MNDIFMNAIIWFFAGSFFTVANLLAVYWYRVWQLRRRAEPHEEFSRITGTTYFKIVFNPSDLSDEAMKCLMKEIERIEAADETAHQCKLEKNDTNRSSNEPHSDK